MTNPLISIIVPNYNHAGYLRARLESVYEQTYPFFEVILLDDCSTDNSQEILNLYRRHPKTMRVIFNKENTGSPLKQWFKGVEIAQGQYIWIAESDDYCEKNFLQSVLDFTTKTKNDLGLIYCQSNDVDSEGNIVENRINYTSEFHPNIWSDNFVMHGEKFIVSYLKVKNVIPNASAVIFKKSLIDQIRKTNIPLNMQMCGDWIFWIHLCKETSVGFVSNTMNHFRNHNKSTRNHFSLTRKRVRILEEVKIRKFLEKNFDLDQKKEIKKLYTKWIRLYPLYNFWKSDFYQVSLKTFPFISFLLYRLKKKFINRLKISQ